ncbi:transcriptional regulator [Rothia nasimurium]|uniref:transcriptional regulator n=1 Tax=Rothia nasimurium TaxID=85336 RepID=UPI001F3BF517|nr:transcriptional regulator [Rothia nasimurium]
MTEPKLSDYTDYIYLPDARTARDMATYLTRARSVDPQAAVRLQANGDVLGISVCVLAPETLLDSTPTIIGLRAIKLAQPAEVDLTVEAAALLDRLARIEEAGLALALPPVTVTAPWVGRTVPRSGWEKKGFYLSDHARAAAQEGISAVDGALPANPGHAVVATVRSRIWSSPLAAPDTTADLPTGAAFALEVLGFLPPRATEPMPVFTSGRWARISARAGHVLVYSATSA